MLVQKKPIPVEALGPLAESKMVTTAHGRIRAEAGDYVLTDPGTGDTWPIKPDRYAATYEPVDSDIVITRDGTCVPDSARHFLAGVAAVRQ